MKRPHARMISFNKRILNPVMLKFAGSVSPFAVIRHVGRRSGKPYKTPLIVMPAADGFVIALTYGPEVDWYRNLRAAGRATLVWRGREYAIAQPEPLDSQTGLLAFPAPFRLILRTLNRIEHFAKVRSQIVVPTV